MRVQVHICVYVGEGQGKLLAVISLMLSAPWVASFFCVSWSPGWPQIHPVAKHDMLELAVCINVANVYGTRDPTQDPVCAGQALYPFSYTSYLSVLFLLRWDLCWPRSHQIDRSPQPLICLIPIHSISSGSQSPHTDTEIAER